MKADQINCGGVLYAVSPETRKMTVRLTIDGAAEVQSQWQVPQDCLLMHATAWCEDSNGLEACRVGWVNDQGQNREFWAQDRNTDVLYPVASTVFTDANAAVNLPDWNLVFLEGTYRTFIAQNVIGVPTYDLEITLWFNLLRKLTPDEAAERSSSRTRMLEMIADVLQGRGLLGR